MRQLGGTETVLYDNEQMQSAFPPGHHFRD